MSEPALYAVFGQPIKHSLSPEIHAEFARQTGQKIIYQAREVGPNQFAQAIDTFLAEGGMGLNCTVPLKELAWQRADRTTVRADLSKAVNTLIRQPDESLLGDNTDGVGLLNDLAQRGIELAGRSILIVGAGGATRGIIQPLSEAGPTSLNVVNRTVDKALQLAKDFAQIKAIEVFTFPQLPGRRFDLIINATSMSLAQQIPPLPDDCLNADGVCYDLAYNLQTGTPFVRWGVDHGAKQSLDGIGMLVEQAAEAFYLWRGIRPDTKTVLKKLTHQ